MIKPSSNFIEICFDLDVNCKNITIEWLSTKGVLIECQTDNCIRIAPDPYALKNGDNCIEGYVKCNDCKFGNSKPKYFKKCFCTTKSDCESCQNCDKSSGNDFGICIDQLTDKQKKENRLCNGDCPPNLPYVDPLTNNCVECREGSVHPEDPCIVCINGEWEEKCDNCDSSTGEAVCKECLTSEDCKNNTNGKTRCTDNGCDCEDGYQWSFKEKKCIIIPECNGIGSCPDGEDCVTITLPNGTITKQCRPIKCRPGFIWVPNLGCVKECDCITRNCNDNTGNSGCADHPTMPNKCYCINCGNRDCNSEEGGGCGPENDKDACICKEVNGNTICVGNPCNGLNVPDGFICDNGIIKLSGTGGSNGSGNNCVNKITLSKNNTDCSIKAVLNANCCPCPNVAAKLSYNIVNNNLIDVKINYTKNSINGPDFTAINDTRIAHNEQFSGGALRLELSGFKYNNSGVELPNGTFEINSVPISTNIQGGITTPIPNETATAVKVTYGNLINSDRIQIKVFRENIELKGVNCRYFEEVIDELELIKNNNGLFDINTSELIEDISEKNFYIGNPDSNNCAKPLFTWKQEGKIIRQEYSTNNTDIINYDNSGIEFGAELNSNNEKLRPCLDITVDTGSCGCDPETIDTEFCKPDSVAFNFKDDCRSEVEIVIPESCKLHVNNGSYIKFEVDGVPIVFTTTVVTGTTFPTAISNDPDPIRIPIPGNTPESSRAVANLNNVETVTTSVDKIPTSINTQTISYNNNKSIISIKYQLYCSNGILVCEFEDDIERLVSPVPTKAVCNLTTVNSEKEFCGTLTFPNALEEVYLVSPTEVRLIDGTIINSGTTLNDPDSDITNELTICGDIKEIVVGFRKCTDRENETITISIPESESSECQLLAKVKDPCSCKTRVDLGNDQECFGEKITWDITGYDRLVLTSFSVIGNIYDSTTNALIINPLEYATSIINSQTGNTKELAFCINGSYSIKAFAESDLDTVDPIAVNNSNECIFSNCCCQVSFYQFATNSYCKNDTPQLIINGQSSCVLTFELINLNSGITSLRTLSYDSERVSTNSNQNSNTYDFPLDPGNYSLKLVSMSNNNGCDNNNIPDIVTSVIVLDDKSYNTDFSYTKTATGCQMTITVKENNGPNVNGAKVTNSTTNQFLGFTNTQGVLTAPVNEGDLIRVEIENSNTQCGNTEFSDIVQCECTTGIIPTILGELICENTNSITLSSQNGIPNGVVAQWGINGTNQVGQNSSQFVIQNPVIGTVINLTFTTSDGCSEETSYVIESGGRLNAKINDGQTSAIVCPDASVELAVTATNAVSYLWNITGTNLVFNQSSNTDPAVILTTPDPMVNAPYNISVTVTNANGCTEVIPFTIIDCNTSTNGNDCAGCEYEIIARDPQTGSNILDTYITNSPIFAHSRSVELILQKTCNGIVTIEETKPAVVEIAESVTLQAGHQNSAFVSFDIINNGVPQTVTVPSGVNGSSYQEVTDWLNTLNIGLNSPSTFRNLSITDDNIASRIFHLVIPSNNGGFDLNGGFTTTNGFNSYIGTTTDAWYPSEEVTFNTPCGVLTYFTAEDISTRVNTTAIAYNQVSFINQIPINANSLIPQTGHNPICCESLNCSNVSGSSSVIDETCSTNNTQDGQITITPINTTGVVTYTLAGIETNTTGVFTGLTSGNYSWSFIDENNCNASNNAVVGDQSICNSNCPPATITETVNCNNDGTGSVQISGVSNHNIYVNNNNVTFNPSNPTSNNWSIFDNNTNLASSTYFFIGLNNDGSECTTNLLEVLVNCGNGNCTDPVNFVNNNPNNGITVSCQSNSIIDVTSIGNLQAICTGCCSGQIGSYNVTKTITSSNPSFQTISNTFNNATINCSSQLGVSGGATRNCSEFNVGDVITSTTTFTFNLSDCQNGGSNTATIVDTYTIQASDLSCCNTVDCNSVTIVGSHSNVDNADCGQSNGVINNLQVSGGTAPYTITSDNVNFTTQNNVQENTPIQITGLATGVYTLTIIDSNNCNGTYNIAVGNNGGCTQGDVLNANFVIDNDPIYDAHFLTDITILSCSNQTFVFSGVGNNGGTGNHEFMLVNNSTCSDLEVVESYFQSNRVMVTANDVENGLNTLLSDAGYSSTVSVSSSGITLNIANCEQLKSIKATVFAVSVDNANCNTSDFKPSSNSSETTICCI